MTPRGDHWLQALPDAVVITSGAGIIERVNPRAVALFGYPPAELIGQPVDILVPDDLRLAPATHHGAGAVSPTPALMSLSRETVAVRKDGSLIEVEILLNTVPLGDGTKVIASVRDVSSRRAEAQSLRESERRFRLAFDDAPVAAALIGLQGRQRSRFLHVNRALCELTGYRADQLVGHRFQMLNHPEDQLHSARRFTRLAVGELDRAERERRYRHADGHDLWLHLQSSPVRDGDDAPARAIVQLADLSARHETETRLSHLALHDSLTDLPNRALLIDHLAAAIKRVQRSRLWLAVMFVDLDDFKQVNDRFGHDTGDRLLVEVAQRLRQCLRNPDIVARLGGDEFVIVCEELRDPAEIHSVAARAERALALPVDLSGQTLSVSASIGIAVHVSGQPPERLLREADAAMYRAKLRGPGRHEIFDSSLQAGANRRLRLLGDLQSGLARGELRLDYQPCVDLLTDAVQAVEGLLRWDHPDAGLLGPADFLDVAEREGFGEEIGDLVIATACRQANAWRRQLGERTPTLWLNISHRQLGHLRLVRAIRKASLQHQLPADALGLDIAERDLAAVTQPMKAELHSLCALGVRLAIDNFRFDRSSIQHLGDLRIDTLKLERTLVGGVERDRATVALIRSAATLARSLDLQLVAKGVETSAQREILPKLGCTVGQGYLFGAPAPPEALALETG